METMSRDEWERWEEQHATESWRASLRERLAEMRGEAEQQFAAVDRLIGDGKSEEALEMLFGISSDLEHQARDLGERMGL